MKSITIICLPSSDTKIIFSDKSLAKENNATKLIVDYSNTPVADWIKVINFKMSDGTEQKVELNTLPVVEMLLTSAFTVAGDLEIAPYAISSNDPNPNRMQFKPRLIGNEYFTDVFINSAEEHPDIFDQIFVDINNLKENKADQEYVDATFQEKEVGKGLSQENYTTEEKAKLNGVEPGAQVNTVNSVAGKTGAVELTKADVGLNNVNNTADLNKPISHPQQAALDDKAPLNHTHTKEQITDFTHVHPISEITGLQTVLDVKVDKLFATNLVTNSDFSNGTTGWSGVDTSSSIVGSRLYNNGSNVSIKQVFRSIQAAPTSHRFYVRYSYELISGSVGVGIKGQAVINDVATVGVGIFSKITSGGVEANNNLTVNFAISSQCYVDNILAINLTQLFGAGNEPTKEQMDYLLSNFPNSWFNGTVELMNYKQLLDYVIDLDNAKANKVQEAWITPTLLNGATTNVNNPIRYRKSQFGVVEFNGELTSGSGTCFTLPVGYLTAINRTGRQPIVTVTGTTLGVFTIVAQNAVFITQGAAYSLSGVRYIAEA